MDLGLKIADYSLPQTLAQRSSLRQSGIFSAMAERMTFRRASVLSTGLLVALIAYGQPSIETTLKRYNRESVPYISSEELNRIEGPYLLLDTRKRKEFEVSHISGARWTGYRAFDLDTFREEYPKKETPIIVYCSVGVRSEDIGEKLLDVGYTDVKNLYGGIFEWKNRGFPVYTPQGKRTERVHAYSRRWGRLLNNAEKIY